MAVSAITLTTQASPTADKAVVKAATDAVRSILESSISAVIRGSYCTRVRRALGLGFLAQYPELYRYTRVSASAEDRANGRVEVRLIIGDSDISILAQRTVAPAAS